jgi:putative ABC transport system permease protein
VRQLLAEGVLLSLLGGVAGLGLGIASMRLLQRLPVLAYYLAAADLSPDARIAAFTAVVALGSALFFSLPPAFRASRPELVSALRTGTPGGGGGRSRLRSGLLVTQLALSMVLLVVAGLFVRTLAALYTIPVGYATERVLIATLDLGLQGYDEARGRTFFTDVERRAADLPGVRSASLGYMPPLGGGGWDMRLFAAERAPAPDDPGVKTDINIVTPGYFATLAIPIVRGRGFTLADRNGAPQVAVINEALANRLWPGEDPVGKRYRPARDAAPIEVIGVVSTGKYRSLLEAPLPFLYLPFAQNYQAEMTLHLDVRDPDPLALTSAVRRLVASLDPDLPIFRVQTLGDRLDRSVGQQRTIADIIGAYGLLALLMTAVGLYGAMAYLVSRRTHEIGIRMALGARSGAVMGRVLRDALRLAALGTTLGLIAAVPAARLVRSQLYGVTPSDPVTLSLVILLLLAVATLAAMVPARRATRVDPVEALRSE